MIDGIINVYKEKGYTSFDVVAKLRGILKQKKIGHTGTLDPMAEGVLMVCLGKATKLVDMLTVGEKEYRAVMQLGISTDTEDITGNVLQSNEIPASLNVDEIIDTVNVSSIAWIKSKQGNGNTLEDQVIKLIEDPLILEYKRWQVFIKRMLVFLSLYK